MVERVGELASGLEGGRIQGKALGKYKLKLYKVQVQVKVWRARAQETPKRLPRAPKESLKRLTLGQIG